MVRCVCPDCDELVEITPTGKKKHEGFSAEWWRVVLHKDKRALAPPDELCPGSGREL